MKQLFIVAAMALGAAACTDNLRPIQLREAKPLDADCAEEDIGQYAGTLDLAPLNNGVPLSIMSYLKSYTIASTMEEVDLSVSEAPLANTGRNNFIGEDIVYTFESQPPAKFASEIRPVYFVVPAASEDSRININLITPKALETLQALVKEQPAGGSVQLITRFRIRGHLASGVSTETDEATYPITVYNSGLSCPSGQSIAFTGACGGPSGADSPASCTPPPETTE
ncbi:hypothetical protein P2318_26730 [Myxococcaceae bacterium GXIMD 01537]